MVRGVGDTPRYPLTECALKTPRIDPNCSKRDYIRYKMIRTVMILFDLKQVSTPFRKKCQLHSCETKLSRGVDFNQIQNMP